MLLAEAEEVFFAAPAPPLTGDEERLEGTVTAAVAADPAPALVPDASAVTEAGPPDDDFDADFFGFNAGSDSDAGPPDPDPGADADPGADDGPGCDTDLDPDAGPGSGSGATADPDRDVGCGFDSDSNLDAAAPGLGPGRTAALGLVAEFGSDSEVAAVNETPNGGLLEPPPPQLPPLLPAISPSR